MRNTGLVRRGNIDHRHTIGGLIHSGIAFGYVNALGQYRQQRLPCQQCAQGITQQALRGIKVLIIIMFHP
ncbi:hypothetical protein D3C80_470730 [compost metagenome]